MNNDTGELRRLTGAQIDALGRAGQSWTPVTPREVTHLKALPPERRPAALAKWRNRKARLHLRAIARG